MTNTPVPYEQQCDHCEGEALVGWGSRPVWLCLDHFTAELHSERERVLSAIETAGERGLIG